MDNEKQKPVLINYKEISEEALFGIIENYIQREGTDYGVVEISPEKKFENLKKQVIRGDVLILFDPESESVTLANKADYQRLLKS